MTGPVVVALTARGLETARRIAGALSGAEIHGLAGRCDGAEVVFESLTEHLIDLFGESRAIVGVCAAGILVRALAPRLGDKRTEPPVIAVAEDASAVVPLIGGHRGANDLAREIAAAVDGAAAITTASDLALGLALDEPPPGYLLANPGDAKAVAASLLAGEPVRVIGSAPWLDAARLDRADDAAIGIVVTERAVEGTSALLVYHPQTLAVGVGAERGADPAAASLLVRQALAGAGLARQAVAVVASLDLKEDEPAVLEVLGACPTRFFTAATLEALTPRLANPSQAVYRAVGCHGVAEAAALAAAGPEAALVVAKQVGDRVTCAIAKALAPIDPEHVGRPRGELAIVGLGPGGRAMRSAAASRALAEAADLVGYRRYLDLAGPLRDGQRRHGFELGQEEARAARALALAAEGRRVALVSSGDPGIYAMASLVFQMIEEGPDAWRRIAVTVHPGISAIQAAAARAGAPLGHDFCAISLSDLMTPAEVIETRLRAAAEADFVIGLYNPASRRRRGLLARALAIIAKHRPAATPVVCARNVGREEEEIAISTLAAFDPEIVDMTTIVLVGSSTTRAAALNDGRRFVYTPRGYAPARAPKLAATR